MRLYALTELHDPDAIELFITELPSVIADVPADARCLYRWPLDRSE